MVRLVHTAAVSRSRRLLRRGAHVLAATHTRADMRSERTVAALGNAQADQNHADDDKDGDTDT